MTSVSDTTYGSEAETRRRALPIRAWNPDGRIVRLLTDTARPLRGAPEDYDALLARIGDARIVLLGESSHGTHEFYAERARITRRLIEEKGFTVVAAEADWPDASRVDRYLRGVGGDLAAVEALADFRRFPAWMWRNADVLEFVGWMRRWNDQLAEDEPRVGFFGLDLYSLHSSAEAVLRYLDQVDPEAARRAREAYACLYQFGEDPQRYGQASRFGLTKGCEEAVVQQLVALRQGRAAYLARDGSVAADAYFDAEQNARIVRNAEGYYRAMFGGRVSSWNLRDTHMVDTLEALLTHASRKQGEPARAVVWAHNSHVGDARHTEFGSWGQVNVGQLARERFGDQVVIVGFTTSTGMVTAASDWGAPAERKWVRPPLEGSYEFLFHRVPMPAWTLDLGDEAAREALSDPRLERAIGVIYRPDTERHSHYFRAQLPDQFDVLIHIEDTGAVEPLEGAAPLAAEELPETYPEGV